MKIYGSKIGGNPLRVALFLAEKGVEIPFVPVDLLQGAHRAPEFLAKNPVAQVPVLEIDDGTCISETPAICRYLERLHPAPPLLGTDALEEALIGMWERRIEFNLYLPARAVFRHTSPHVRALEPVQIAAWAELNRPRVSEGLQLVDRQLAAHRFVAGARYSAADIALFFALQMTARIAIPVAESGEHIARWHAEVSRRPGVVAVFGPHAS